MSNDAAAVLRRALELLGPDGEHFDGGQSLLGALTETADSPNQIAEILITLTTTAGHNILGDGLTWPEVKAAFERAIEMAVEAGCE